MPSYSGVWTLSQQFQGRGQGLWPAVPGAPTIGTATVASTTSVSVPFTAPACAGVPATITGYTATSTPGCITGTAASSPITVSGLTTGTAYTFKVKAQNAAGFGPCSAASNSVTPAVVQGQQAYTTAGTFSWVAPTGVTSVSVVAVGGGAFKGAGGLGYKNNYAVTPGSSYAVVVGVAGSGGGASGGTSHFVTTSVVRGGGGTANGSGGTYTGDGGGNGGTSSSLNGGGAGGYAGNGGSCTTGYPGTGYAGAGGGGGSGGTSRYSCDTQYYGGGGGGVGILGQGSNGSGGTTGGVGSTAGGGGGGSSGASGSGSTTAFGPGAGGAYGGGGGGGIYFPGCCTEFAYFGASGVGAVRIIWPGTTRSFPSTNTGNL
jgi:hypothetical protein